MEKDEFPTTFKDAKGRSWCVALSVAALKRMREMARFQLDDIFSAKEEKEKPEKLVERYQAFLDDDMRVSEVLYAILKPQCDNLNVSQEEFDEGLSGNVNVNAIMALHQAMTDFSQPSRKTFLRGVTMSMKKTEKAMKSYEKRMAKEADKLTDEAIDAVVNKEADAVFANTVFGLPATSK